MNHSLFTSLPFSRPRAALAAFSLLLSISASAQGPISPTGAPGPTMRSLDQIQPRFPIPGPAVGMVPPYTLSQPGSYYLTGNVTFSGGTAIAIAADNVSLDLNGFTITSNNGSPIGDAINIDGRSNLAISNGGIRSGSTVNGSGAVTPGTGFAGGINWNSSAPSNVRVSNVTVVGVSSYPIDLGGDGSSVVQGCAVSVAGNYGIQAGTVSNSTALLCGSTPIQATTISNCVGSLASNGTLTVLDTSTTSGATAASVASIQTGVTSANSGITTANSGITAANTTINATNTNVTTANSNINTANTNITTANTGIASLLATTDKRIPIPSAAVGLTPPYAITQSGSYYLTQNISSAGNGSFIDVRVGNVTLDLNGFAIISTASTVNSVGITVASGLDGVTIRNGIISSGTSLSGSTFTTRGFAVGINAFSVTNVTIEGIRIRGIGGDGIDLSSSSNTMVRACEVNVASGFGIQADQIFDSTAIGIGQTAIYGAFVSRCRGTCVNPAAGANSIGITAGQCADSTGSAAGGNGIDLTSFSSPGTASNCIGKSASGYGINGAVLTGCTGTSGSSYGIFATSAAFNCHGESTSSFGLIATAATNCYGKTAGTAAAATGLSCASGTATGCTGVGNGGLSLALRANIAIGCIAINGSVSITNKYNMP